MNAFLRSLWRVTKDYLGLCLAFGGFMLTVAALAVLLSPGGLLILLAVVVVCVVAWQERDS